MPIGKYTWLERSFEDEDEKDDKKGKDKSKDEDEEEEKIPDSQLAAEIQIGAFLPIRVSYLQ